MKTIVATFSSLMVGVGLLSAGPMIDKNPIVPDVCDCYPPGFQVGGFAAGFFVDGDAEIGGGASLAYFFTEQIGIDISYAAFDTDPDVLHLSTADLIYRLSIDDSNCLAPYLIGGGGVLSNGESRGLYRAGIGVEVRFENKNCWGIFADGTYNWIEDSENGAVARVGVRIPW